MKKEKSNTEIKEKKKHNTVNIIGNIFVGIFAVVAIFFFVNTIIYKVNGNECYVFGNTEIRVVLTESMTWTDSTPEEVKNYEIKGINKNDAVFIDKAPSNEEELKTYYTNLKVGDVLNFTYKTSGTLYNVTHRCVAKVTYGNGYCFTMQGDNYSQGIPSYQFIYTCTDKANPEPYNEIRGKVTKTSSFLGGLLSFANSKVGIIVLIIVPCLLIIVYEVIKLIVYFSKEKEKKTLAIQNEKDEEIKRLKEELKKKEKK